MTANLSAVALSDASHGWVVGYDGIFLATANGGALWTQSGSVTSDDLAAVDFVTASQGWAVGAGGAIVATSDGGSVWATQNSGAGRNLAGVDFVDALRGWAVGAHGTIVATGNGGATWTPQPSGTTDDIGAVTFTDADHGCAVGGGYRSATKSYSGVILTTANGGTTRHAQRPAATNLHGLDAVAFAGASNGWVADASGTIFATTNGGTTWHAQTSGLAARKRGLYGIDFVDASHGWAVGASGIVASTTNGGATWQTRHLAFTSDLRAVSFVDQLHGWAVDIEGHVWATTDGGASWGTLSNGPAAPGLFGVSLTDATHGWVVGFGGGILASDPLADLVPPSLTSSGFADGIFSNHALTLSLSAADPPGGSGLAGISYSLDGNNTVATGGAATTIPIAAPSDHTNDDLHYLDCWSADNTGNTAPVLIRFTIETRKPVPVAYAVSAVRGHKAALKYRIKDRDAGGDLARTVSLIVKNPKGKLAKTIRLSNRAVNRTLTKSFVVPRTWARGTYRFSVSATDRAGNRQASAAVGHLVVK